VVIIAFLQWLLRLFLAAFPREPLHNNEWAGNDMKTKIHLLWQLATILRSIHFSERSKVLWKFRTLTVFDRQSVHERRIFLRIWKSQMPFGDSTNCRRLGTEILRQHLGGRERKLIQVPLNSIEKVREESP
jgi:hypothetical protein